MRLTLRELIFVTSIIGIGLAGIVRGPPVAWLGVAICFLIIAGFAIIAFVAVGQHRSFAIGFVVPVFLYGTAVLTAGDDELGMREGMLPTSQLFQSVLQPRYPPSGGLSVVQVIARKQNTTSVMTLGHLLVALALGYSGAKFAVHVHNRSRADRT